MFSFLNKANRNDQKVEDISSSLNLKSELKHNHPSKYRQNFEFKVIPKLIQSHIDKNTQKETIKVKRNKKDNEINLAENVKNELNVLLEEAESSIKNLKANEQIKKYMNEREQTAFIRYTSENQNEYLRKLYEKTTHNQININQGLDCLINGTIDMIERDIEENEYDPQLLKKNLASKEEMKQLEQLNQLNLIKLKQGQLSSKVGQLKLEIHSLQDSQIVPKHKQIASKQHPTPNSKDQQTTKQPSTVSVQNKIEQIKLKKQYIAEKRKLKEIQSKIAKQKQIQQQKIKKHNQLVEKLQAKQILKKQRNQEIQQEKRKFKQFLKQYRNVKPLYQKKLQQQIEQEIKDKKERFQKMLQRKNKYQSISFSQIENFQQKYLQLKKEQQEKRKIQLAMKKDQQIFRLQQMKENNYKGKFRYLVYEQMVNREAKKQEEQFAKKLLFQKKRAYSVDIKQKYKPKIDQNKRRQIQKFVSKTQRKRKPKGPKRVRINSSAGIQQFETINYESEQEQVKDPKKQGYKNMRFFKQYIQQKIKKGEIKRPETLESKATTLTPKIDYLKEQRENRTNSSHVFQSLDSESRIKEIKSLVKGDLNLYKLKSDQLDQKLQRQELKLKHSQHTLHEQKQLESNYLASIEAKLEILKQIN